MASLSPRATRCGAPPASVFSLAPVQGGDWSLTCMSMHDTPAGSTFASSARLHAGRAAACEVARRQVPSQGDDGLACRGVCAAAARRRCEMSKCLHRQNGSGGTPPDAMLSMPGSGFFSCRSGGLLCGENRLACLCARVSGERCSVVDCSSGSSPGASVRFFSPDSIPPEGGYASPFPTPRPLISPLNVGGRDGDDDVCQC